MKKRPALLCIFALLLLLTNLLPAAHASTISAKLRELYAVGDYPAIAKLLEKRIDEIESATAAGSTKADGKEIYNLHLMLAHVCAWQLDRFNDGLAEYERALELRREQEREALQKKIGPNMSSPALEYLFMAGMYEHIKDYARAVEYYQKTLQEAKAYSDALASSGERVFLGNDLTYLIQYAIDTIQIQLQSAKTYTPLAKKIDLMHESNPMMMNFMFATVFPEQEYIFENKSFVLENNNLNMEAFIKHNAASTYSMLLEGGLLTGGLTAITDDSIQRAAEAFLKKYPDSYLSLATGFLLSQNFLKNGDAEKAQSHLDALKKTAKKRNIELVIEPDKKFASPESTWEALRQAMAVGDIEAALSCHTPGDPKYREIYSKFGPEILKKIGADMKPIEKISADEQTAKYRANRKHKDIDKEITYYVYFVKTYGEWKIESM